MKKIITDGFSINRENVGISTNVSLTLKENYPTSEKDLDDLDRLSPGRHFTPLYLVDPFE